MTPETLAIVAAVAAAAGVVSFAGMFVFATYTDYRNRAKPSATYREWLSWWFRNEFDGPGSGIAFAAVVGGFTTLATLLALLYAGVMAVFR